VPSGWSARHPASIASVQQSTRGESTVIRIVPTLIIGALVTTNSSRKAARPPASDAVKRKTATPSTAANNGEKNLTPSCVSPQSQVPAN
jgi:hypothetical protein